VEVRVLKRSPSRRPAAILALLLAAAAGSAACDVNVGAGDFSFGVVSGRAADEVSRKYQVPAGGRFEVVNVNGMIQVEQATGAEVEVRAERIAKAATDEAAKELLGKVEIAETRSGDQVKIETKAPKNFGRGGVEVKYYVKVPAGLKVAAQTTNGGVRLVGISNEVVAATTNGGVSGENLTGSVNVSTTNGGIDLSVGAIGAEGVKAETVNGGVEVTVPRNAKADISARVVNGGLSVGDLPVETVGEQSRRRLEGKLNGGGPRIEIGAVNGGVRLSGQ
jgi:hypothetical protein